MNSKISLHQSRNRPTKFRSRGLWMRKRAEFTLIVLLAIVLLAFPPLAASADPVPASRRIDWTYTGVPGGIPNRTNTCATFNPGASATTVNNAISACSASGGGVVYLNAGTYIVTGINLYNDNVTLRGAGADQTVLQGCNTVNLGSGSNSPSGIGIVGGGAKYSYTISVSRTSAMSVNKMIELDRYDGPHLTVCLRVCQHKSEPY